MNMTYFIIKNIAQFSMLIHSCEMVR
uniref:Uncharacterized protein n=1 Tax=Anguilla anguilla TaxID=7936 RepID=A0A0E9VYM3_ANGAN